MIVMYPGHRKESGLSADMTVMRRWFTWVGWSLGSEYEVESYGRAA